MQQGHRRRLTAGMLMAATAVVAPSQQPAPMPVEPTPAKRPAERPAAADPVDAAFGKAEQALIDEFLGAMPRDPLDLRRAEVRAEVAARCLPVLRRVQEFAAANPKALLAGRVAEFRIYALVLGDAELRATLSARREAGDRDAAVQLAAADVIVANEVPARQRAVATLAKAMAPAPTAPGPAAGTAEAKPTVSPPAMPPPATPAVLDCAVQCLALAAALDESELGTLAAVNPASPAAKRFAALAERLRRDLARVVGQPFTITGRTLGGAEFTSSALRGKVVVVDFWATWCGPCVRALPELVRLRQAIGSERLAVVGVSCDATADAVQKFLAERPELDWPQLFEPGQDRWHPLATRFGIESIPRLLVIDRAGRLFHADAGRNLESIVRECLAQ